MRRNEGFTLIELVVTLVVVAVLSTTVAVSFVSVNNKSGVSALDRLSSALTQTRYLSMTCCSGAVSCVVKKQGDNYVAEITVGGEVEDSYILCDSRFVLSYDTETSTNNVFPDTGYTFTFKKSSGEFIDGAGITAIYALGTSSILKFAKLTGRTYIEQN